MMKHAIPEKTLMLWQIRVSAAAVIITAASVFLMFVSVWFLIFTVLLAVAFAFLLFWYLPHYLRSYELLFPKGAVIINRGVFIKTTHIMPFSRLIYAQSLSTPLAKSLGLAAMSLKAARSSLLIPEIASDDVIRFIEALTAEDSE